jgi:hypothetical protein
MVYSLIGALGVPFTREIATHIYLAILTDTGSFHYSNVSSRTFTICSEMLAAGVDPVQMARTVYDSNTMAKMKLFGSVLSRMQLDETGRIAIVYLDHEMARAAGGTYEDTDGLINLPLTVKEIQAVVFLKQIEGEQYRVSMRSKGEIDIGAVAKEFGGGGHKNAAGCTAHGGIDGLQKIFVEKIRRAIELQDRSVARSEEGANGGSHSLAFRFCVPHLPTRAISWTVSSSSTSPSAPLRTMSSRACVVRSASGVSDIPVRSIRRPAACCRWSSDVRLDSRGF